MSRPQASAGDDGRRCTQDIQKLKVYIIACERVCPEIELISLLAERGMVPRAAPATASISVRSRQRGEAGGPRDNSACNGDHLRRVHRHRPRRHSWVRAWRAAPHPLRHASSVQVIMTNHGVVLGPEDATAAVAVARHFSFPPSRTAGHSLHRRRRWSVVKLARRRRVSVIGAANVGMGIKQINLTRHLAGEIALPDEAPASAADYGTTTTMPYLQQHEASSTSFLPRKYFFAQVTGGSSDDLASFVTECGTHVCVRAGTRLICGTTTTTASRTSHRSSCHGRQQGTYVVYHASLVSVINMHISISGTYIRTFNSW